VINEHQTEDWDAFGTKLVVEPGKLLSVNEESDTDTDASDNDSEPQPTSFSLYASASSPVNS